MVEPETVVAWHREGLAPLSTWKSRRRGPGRPPIDKEIRRLIVEMARRNVGWGAPRIHGELCKLGIHSSQSYVQRYMPKHDAPPGARQRWKTVLHSYLSESLAIDVAVVPTITFDILYVFFVRKVDRRRALHFNLTRHPTAQWTARKRGRCSRTTRAASHSCVRRGT